MSGQYPPPNPAHPFSRAPLHQRPPPSQNLLPPWSHTSQSTALNVVGSPMNFYGSPHMGLSSRGAQSWVPPQTHPKPSDSRPGSTNPLFGLQMLMTPETNQRIPSEYQQEETMDLSSHSSVPTPVEDSTKIVSAKSENSDVLQNGTVLPAEVNGDVNRTEGEVKDSIITSVIATNPLRESIHDALNCSKVSENSVGKRTEQTVIPESLVKNADLFSNPQLNMCVKSDSAVLESISESENSLGSSVLKTTTSSELDCKKETLVSDRLDESSLCIDSSIDNLPDESSQSLDTSSKHIGSLGSVKSPNMNESQPFCLENTLLSVDTDESKLVVAESSAEDIFGISPVNQTSTPQDNKNISVTQVDTETMPENTSEVPPVSVVLKDQWPKKSVLTVASATGDSEPHPSVENVEILLENMFNSQEETSCSSQNSNSGMPQSVIVSNNDAKLPVEDSRPAADVITPMKEEELAMTLAEDNPIEVKPKDEEKDEKVTPELMDEIEKKLEMLTESSLCELPKFDDQADAACSIPNQDKKESYINKDIEEENTNNAVLSKEKETEHENLTPSTIGENLASSTPKTEKDIPSNPFIEVETQLEKMFAGIVEVADEAGSDNPSQPSSSEPKRPVVNKKTIVKRKKANSRRPSDNSVFGGSSGESTPVKKKGRKRVNDSGSEKAVKRVKVDNVENLKKGKIQKEMASDSLSKVKGPFVHIEGSKESPASVVVVNSGVRADDEDGTDKANARRKHSTMQRTEGTSRRTGPAYSSSTLSMRYNSDTADLSWVCVFCKRGPHCAGGLGGEPAGDLFGPYRVPATTHGDETLPLGTPADRDVVDEQKKRGGRYPKSLRTSGTAEHFIQKMAKKSKRSLSSDSSDSQPGLLIVEGGYEVWLHGHCAEWAPGLCIIGTQLVGLDDAVWTALRTRCSQCGETGAGIGCVVHNCPVRMHYHCAVFCDWLLDKETFIARCHAHRTRLRPS